MSHNGAIRVYYGLTHSAAAQKEWRQKGRAGHTLDQEAGDAEWRWLASLLEINEEGESAKEGANGEDEISEEDMEYFPGTDMMAGQCMDNLHTLVTNASEHLYHGTPNGGHSLRESPLS